MDMDSIIPAAKQMQFLTGGLVLRVHHSGKAATKGLRGHSRLYAGLDGAIEVNMTDSCREWRVAKSKDDETGTVHSFKLDVLTVGRDIDGDDVTSCAAASDTTMGAVKRAKLPTAGNQKIAFDILIELLSKSAEFINGGEPGEAPCTRMNEAIGLTAARLLCESKRRTERAHQALASLVAKEVIVLKG